MASQDNNAVVHTPTWERVVGMVGFIFLCVGVIYLSWSAWTDKKLPPDIAINITEINQISNGFLVQIAVVNNGSSAVSILQVEGQLTDADGETQISTAELDYLASESVAHAGLFFTSNPDEGKLILRPLGFQPP